MKCISPIRLHRISVTEIVLCNLLDQYFDADAKWNIIKFTVMSESWTALMPNPAFSFLLKYEVDKSFVITSE